MTEFSKVAFDTAVLVIALTSLVISVRFYSWSRKISLLQGDNNIINYVTSLPIRFTPTPTRARMGANRI